MAKSPKSLARKMAPGLFDNIAQISGMNAQLGQIQNEMNDLKQLIEQRDSRLDTLRKMASEVEPYQPAYGLTHVIDAPRRGCQQRAHAIENWLQPIAGKRILDIGSSLGYFSFYFADRGAGVEGWESNANNAEVARTIGQLNGIGAEFKTKELNNETVLSINKGQFDAVLVLSVLHHVIYFEGLEYTQRLVKNLLDKVPVLIVELAKKGEDPKLRWDNSQPDDELAIFDLVKDKITIKKIGNFRTHLSKKSRPLYVVQNKKQLTVNNHNYEYTTISKQAYANSPIARAATHRRYYFGDNFIIKEYLLDVNSRRENLPQILNEIKILLDIQNGKTKIFRSPVLLDFDINFPSEARLVVQRTNGQLASDLKISTTPAQTVKIAKNILRTIADFQDQGLHHNDIRSWNIIVDSKGGGWLIDYGLVGWKKNEDDIIALLWSLHTLLTNERESSIQNKTELPPEVVFSGHPKLIELYNGVKGGERSAKKLLELM